MPLECFFQAFNVVRKLICPISFLRLKGPTFQIFLNGKSMHGPQSGRKDEERGDKPQKVSSRLHYPCYFTVSCFSNWKIVRASTTFNFTGVLKKRIIQTPVKSTVPSAAPQEMGVSFEYNTVQSGSLFSFAMNADIKRWKRGCFLSVLMHTAGVPIKR